MSAGRATGRSPRATWLALAGILVLGALLRGLYLQEIAQRPDFAHPAADAAFHDWWARAIVSGDFSPPPGNPDPRLREVPYLKPPGYPFFLAGAYALTGGSPVGGRVVQMLLGLINCWLAFLLGRAVFGRGAGLVLAFAGAVYWALIYYEGELHAPVLLVALSFLLLLALAGWLARPRAWRVLVAGLLLGALALVRPNVLVFAPVAAAWLWWQARAHGAESANPAGRAEGAGRAGGEGWRAGIRALPPTGLFLLGAAIAIAPATIRNAVVAGDFVPISANGAVNFHIGNNPVADGVSTRIPGLEAITGQSGWSLFTYDGIVRGLSEREGRPLKYSEVSRLFRRAGLTWIAEHPGDFLALTARRAALFWGPAEVSNNKAIALEKSESRVLRFGPGFPLVLALSLGGAILLLLERRGLPDRSGPLALLVALFVLSVFVSFLPYLVAARFRAPLVPFIFLFAAFGLTRLWQRARSGDWPGVAMAVAGAALLFALCSWSPVAYESDRAWWHVDRALALAAAGEHESALTEFDRALAADPGDADAHLHRGTLLVGLGRLEEAERHYRLGLARHPGRTDLRLRLASLLARRGRGEEALAALQNIVAARPGMAEARFELGRVLLQRGRVDEAEAQLREALRLDPAQPGVLVELGLALAQGGRLDEAIAAQRQAVDLAPEDANARRWLGLTLCAADSVIAGLAACEEALRLAPDAPATAWNLGNFFFGRQRWREAADWFARAEAIDDADSRYPARRGAALANLGELDAAAAAYETAQALAPEDPAIREELRRLDALRARQGMR